MADLRRLATLPDDALADVLRGLAADLAVPAVVADADPARRARLRLETAGQTPDRARGVLERLGLRGPSARPLRRALVFAIVALLVIAAIAGAVGFGLPGIRIVFGPAPSPVASTTPSSSVPPSAASAIPSQPTGPALPGAGLGLGRPVTLADARSAAPHPLSLPDDPRFGPPDATWLDDRGVVTFVWATRPGVAPTRDGSFGLVVSEIPGTVYRDFFEKILGPGTTIEAVQIRGRPGWWISGAPHDFLYVDPSGEPTYDNRRLVGDTLAWSDGTTTYRIETGLGRDDAVRIAESFH